MYIPKNSSRKLAFALTLATLSLGSQQAVALVAAVDFESGSGYTLDGDNAGTATLSSEQSLSPSNSAKFTLTNTQLDFAKVIIDIAPGDMQLGTSSGSFSAYLPSGSLAYLPYMYFGVDTDGNGSFSFGSDSFVIAFITDAGTPSFDTWQMSGIDGSTDVHVVGARPGLDTEDYNANPDSADTLSSLSSISTGLGGTWGDLDILEVRVGIGESGGDSGAHTAYVDDITAVPEPASVALILGGSALGLLCLRRRKARA